MTRYFCTLFDSGYLAKGLVTLTSLKRQCAEAHVFVLCMDEITQDFFGKLTLNFVTCIPLSQIEDNSLLEVKQKRGVAEYCWTLSPCLPWYIFDKYSNVDFLTYIDADLFFYSPVEPVFDEIGNKSIAIIEHRFSARLKDREINGRFCVEWVSFRRNEEGMRCLERWRDQCIEWCYYRLEDGKMGDQKYLDEWPDLYAGCHIIQHLGAGVAPWNYEQYTITRNPAGQITIDGEELIFYHFHQFQILENWNFDRLSSFYSNVSKEPEDIYSIYENEILTALEIILDKLPGFSAGIKKPAIVYARRWVQRFIPFYLKRAIQKLVRY